MTSGVQSVEQQPNIRHLEHLSAEQLRQLLVLSQQFNSTLDLQVLLPLILGSIVERLDAEAAAFWAVGKDGLRCERFLGPDGTRGEGIELPAGAAFAGDAARRRRALLIANARADDRYLHQLDAITGLDTASVMAVPLLANGDVVGVIEAVNRRSGGSFEKEHLAFLVALADDAGAAIRNARLLEAEKQARDLRALIDFSREITSTFDIERIVVSVVNLAGDAIHFDRCAIATWQGDDLIVRAISGETKLEPRSAPVREIDRFMTWATAGREELVIPDVDDPADEMAARVRELFPEYLAQARARCVLVEDIRDAEGDLGVLLFEFERPHAVTAWGTRAARLLANQAALALRNAQLYAGVPFISWLEPLARRRQALAQMPRAQQLRYAAIAISVLLLALLVRLPLRIPAAEAEVRAAVQRPVRAGVDGVLDEVLVVEGERVEPGTTVARLRDEPGLIRLREAEAALAVAEREALAAEARGDANAATLARVRVAEAVTAVQVLRGEQRRTLLAAGAGGVVLTPRLEEKLGSRFEAGSVVAWIGDPEWVELELRVRQADVGEIREGDRVRARVTAHPSVTFEGHVLSIAPRADTTADEPRYTVRAALDNRAGLLRPGMEARAKVLARSRPVLFLALRRPWRWVRMNSWWVWPL
jgi:GAF domain-containing protein